MKTAHETDTSGALVMAEDSSFCSGVNHHQEIAGLALAGVHVGMVAKQITGKMWDELETSSRGALKVFVDSGAFSEVAFTADGPQVVEAITDADWKERLSIYRRVAAMYGERCWLVAPDMVGNQAVTLERLSTYAAQVAELRAMGANIIVPFQRGALSHAQFAKKAAAILGWGMCRCACEALVRDAGFPVPRKSACVFCPYASKRDWQTLATQAPDLFSKVVELEAKKPPTKRGIKLSIMGFRTLKDKAGKPTGKYSAPPLPVFIQGTYRGKPKPCGVCGAEARATKATGCDYLP